MTQPSSPAPDPDRQSTQSGQAAPAPSGQVTDEQAEHWGGHPEACLDWPDCHHATAADERTCDEAFIDHLLADRTQAQQRIGGLEAALRQRSMAYHALVAMNRLPRSGGAIPDWRTCPDEPCERDHDLLAPPGQEREEVAPLPHREGWPKPPYPPIEDVATRTVLEDEEAQHEP